MADHAFDGIVVSLRPETRHAPVGVDPARAHADFVNGAVDGGELD